ncbi:MAG: beta-ketoacyl-[acyl-carrier-protein] synthase II, partial [Spirochaetales bacterium]|nr:beta-ketoacyl-[acyl-carrier-protein] synthase II [Spirochaetales bacterium]
MDRRVVVTGLGAITPIGNTVEETWQAMKTGKNGIDKITLFDTTGFKATLAAEVKNFEVSKYLDVNETLRTDRYVQFAVAAADMAVKESGIE